ncbi:hypothetical protein, partial [Duncaniella dubosii]|uniref:hypothetical protein n=1 Tax=Duncaniella dubosii TaxID=2518971 RepID=UPI00143D749E
LDQNNFHRIRLTGEATLRNLKFPCQNFLPTIFTDDGAETWDKLIVHSRRYQRRLASDRVIENRHNISRNHRHDSTGIRSENGCRMPEHLIVSRHQHNQTLLAADCGDRLLFRSTEDSTRIRLRKSTVGATLRRYKDDKTKPQLVLNSLPTVPSMVTVSTGRYSESHFCS